MSRKSRTVKVLLNLNTTLHLLPYDYTFLSTTNEVGRINFYFRKYENLDATVIIGDYTNCKEILIPKRTPIYQTSFTKGGFLSYISEHPNETVTVIVHGESLWK